MTIVMHTPYVIMGGAMAVLLLAVGRTSLPRVLGFNGSDSGATYHVLGLAMRYHGSLTADRMLWCQSGRVC